MKGTATAGPLRAEAHIVSSVTFYGGRLFESDTDFMDTGKVSKLVMMRLENGTRSNLKARLNRAADAASDEAIERATEDLEDAVAEG